MAAVQPSSYCLFEQRLASRHERRADCGCDGYPVSLERNNSVRACSTFVRMAATCMLELCRGIVQWYSAHLHIHLKQFLLLCIIYGQHWLPHVAKKLTLPCTHKEFPRMMDGTLQEIWLFRNKDIKSNQTYSLHFWETSYPFSHVLYYIISWTPTLHHSVVIQMCAVEEYKTVNPLKRCSKMRYWSYFLVLLHTNITHNSFSSGDFIKIAT